jgi:hypothetical protein
MRRGERQTDRPRLRNFLAAIQAQSELFTENSGKNFLEA